MTTYSSTGEPSRKNVDTRGEDIDEGAVVAEACELVSAVGSADSEGSRLRGGGVAGSVGTVVTSGNGHENSGRYHAGGGRVDSSGLAATERHVGNSTVGAAAGLDITSDEVDTGDDTRVGTLSRSVKERGDV
jgi:hypothetical protein